VGPTISSDREALDRWCDAVGPAMIEARVPADSVGVDRLAVVSWNVHVGGGDVAALVAHLRSGALSRGRPVRDFVLLLQEVYRSGHRVPSGLLSLVGVPQAIRPSTAGRPREDIAAVAARLGLAVYYVPSMRNGAPGFTDEDRGNAIVSTLPLSDLSAIELPFERQRRVAVSATVHGQSSEGRPWSLIVTSAHLDNLAGARRMWILASPARHRQARGLLSALAADGPAILGGDLNTWFGRKEPAYREIASRFPQTPTGDDRPTFAGVLRLDHLFFRLPEGWTAETSRLVSRYGSDHHPLLGWVQITASQNVSRRQAEHTIIRPSANMLRPTG
jgi:endonuclease/exonuclease/phosphatase family metal-dependent hydrolase